MKKPRMAVSSQDVPIMELVISTEHNLLAIWAADCAERVLPYFENLFAADNRPRQAIEAARAWSRGEIRTGQARQAALAAHAAARASGEATPACSAARAAGHAAATAHVPRHAAAAGIYAATVLRDVSPSAEAPAATEMERVWQYQHLLFLRKKTLQPPPD